MMAIIVAHLILGALILLGNNSFPAPRLSTLTAIDISKDVPVPDAPAKPAVVPPVPDERMVALLPSVSVVDAAPPAAGSSTGNGCSVASTIGAALLADQDAMVELAALPAGVRSESDAVMLWNGEWIDAASETEMQMTQTPIPALKRVVTDAIIALPAECREVQTAGPQLIPIPEQGRTTMVVIGSGVWRWANLLEPPLPTDQANYSVGDWFASLELSGN